MKRIPLCLALICVSSPALAVQVTCPADVQMLPRVTTKAKTDGWIAVTGREKYAFSLLALYDGPPSELASLKPDNGDDATGPYLWSLAEDETYWVSCEYGPSGERGINDRVLTLKLPPVSACSTDGDRVIVCE